MKDNIKKINKESLKKISIITLVGAIVLIVGGTLATFNFDVLFEGLSTNKLSTCKLSLNVKDDNPITLVEAYPISDEKAKEYSPYTFTITNKSDCEQAYYKITLGDICNTCSKTNNICTVNGQSLNCSSNYKLNSSKVKYELVNKNTNEVFKNVNPENIELTGQIAKDESINFELKFWIDSSATNQNLYVYENGKPKENSDGSIVTKNAGFKLNIEGQDKQFNLRNKDNSGANVPVLASNMIPVYYDSANEVWKKADATNSDFVYQWYDYNSKMWANAVTVKETNRSTYLNASAGTTIPISDINAMFVWIPRYKYTYFSSNVSDEISITFENGTASTGTISCTGAITSGSGKSEVCTDSTNGSIIKGTSTYTHPAFTFGDGELAGIWVGKYETSGGDAYTIKPDVIPTRNMNISTLFKHSRNMELSNNIYGFSQTGTTLNSITGEISGDSNNLDTHLLKNMEWGAATYLSHSKYGTCENGICIEVGINNYYDADLLTGCGAAAGSSSSNVCNKYNTTEGMKASTTGNVYGIYDMSGGAWEYVMVNMQDANNKFYPESSGTWSTTDVPLDKYYDKYSLDEGGNGSGYRYGRLGDAIIEMQPNVNNFRTWYNDFAYFLNSGFPWLIRGGRNSGNIGAGVFGFSCDNGNAGAFGGSRVALSVLP